MGDNDVICLSSDDEFAQDVLPQKKPKTKRISVTAKIELKDKVKENIFSCAKRKRSEDCQKSDGNLMKKLKIENNDIEEIIIESPVKDSNEESRSDMTVLEHSSDLRAEFLKDVIENGTISIKKVTVKKTLEFSKSADQPKSSHSKIATTSVRNNVQKLQSSTTNSKESNGKVADTSKFHNLKSTLEMLSSRVINPVAKFKDTENSVSPSSTMSNIVHKFFETKAAELGKSTNGETSLDAKSHIEKSKAEASPIAVDKNAIGTSTKSLNKTPTSFSKFSTVVDITENLIVGSAAESDTDRENIPVKKSDDCREIREGSKSPEVLILPITDTPKASRNASDKTGVTANSNEGLSTSERNNVQNIESTTSDTPKISRKSQLPCITNCQILNDDSKKDISNITDDLINGIKGNKTISLTLTTGSPKIQRKDEKIVIKRIAPQKLPESLNNSNRSKESDEKVTNGVEKPMPSDSKNVETTKDSKSKDFEPTPGCSKSPDEKSKKSPSVVSSLRLKSPRSENVKKINKDESETIDFEPQPGCSKSLDEIDEKPSLIVVEKKPVLHEVDHDTFSMFLSLCLQIDRCPDMERVVAKLKRYYDELNPAYAASQAFQDTLNEKRDLITAKGKKVVYHYVQLLKKDMKAKRRINVPAVKARDDETTTDGAEDASMHNDDTEDEDSEETRRQRQKIKRIEKAMKECQKFIKKYEEAEVDFDNENNSHYIKMNRFKERMVELYTQMCKYTHEHPDAGRAYLRPKHLRVTQIPSIDQAINSFINSKLSVNKKNIAKGKSFVDGLIFPDYVDILECVEKVNKENDLKLDKRAMNNLAEKAFTQLGKYLQEARQSDYWDTFSLHLENNADPASADSDLLEKLSRNREIAEVNEKKVFEEFVRKQEEGKDKEDSSSEEESDEEEEEEEEEEEDNDKKTNRSDESDVEISINEDSDRESEKGDKNDILKAEECIVEDSAKHISDNNDLEASNSTADKTVVSPASCPKKSAGKEVIPIEVTLDDVDSEDGVNEPLQEEKAQQPLRLRSFAKPPEFWQCSQESKEETNKDNRTKTKTLESTEDEITVVSYHPKKEKVLQNLTSAGNTVTSTTITRNITSSATTKTKLATVQALNIVNTTANPTHSQNVRYLTIAPGVTVPIQLPPSLVKNNIQTTVTDTRPFSAVPATMRQTNLNNTLQQIRIANPGSLKPGQITQIRLQMPVATSTPIQRLQSQSNIICRQPTNAHTPLQQTNKMSVQRLSNEKCAAMIFAPCLPSALRIATAAAAAISTPLRLSQIQPRPLNSNQLKKPSVTSTPIQSGPSNTLHKKVAKVLTPITLTAAKCSQMQVVRLNNGKYIAKPSSSLENLRTSREQQAERNTVQQPQKLKSDVSSVEITVKGTNIVKQTPPPPVLKLRMTDNVQTNQQQKTNAPKVTKPGDQNQEISESGPKRKNEFF